MCIRPPITEKGVRVATPYGMAPLGFDHGGCDDLALEFEGVADLLDLQADERTRVAVTPRDSWEGDLALQFDDRVALTVADGGEIATALRTAATGLRELADAAEREDARREQARAWSAQQDRGFWGNIGDNVGDFFTGDEDIPPPPPPEDPPMTEVLVSVTPDRDAAA